MTDRIDNVRHRLKKTGDLWKPLLQAKGRVDLARFLEGLRARPAGRTSRAR